MSVGIKRAILIAFGFLPLGVGFLMSHLMMTIWFYQLPPVFVLNLIGPTLLAVWTLASLTATKFFSGKIEILLLQNAGGLVALVLVLIQASLSPFWTPGIIAQNFFLPLLSAAMSVIRTLTFIHSFPWQLMFIIPVLMLVLASYLGVRIGRRLRA